MQVEVLRSFYDPESGRHGYKGDITDISDKLYKRSPNMFKPVGGVVNRQTLREKQVEKSAKSTARKRSKK